MEALWTSVMWDHDLVLDRADGPSSLVASLSTATELLKGRVNVTTANGVRWGTRFALVVVLSHFPELETNLELLGTERNTDLMEDQMDALWTQVRSASDSLASHVLPSVTHSPPDGAGEW
jgi:hypothetical protein